VTKIAKTIFIGLMMISLILTLVSASVEIVDSEITLNVDYRNFNDEDQDILAVSTNSFNLVNTDPVEKIVTLAASGLPSGYSADSKEISIPGNGTQSVTLTINATHENDGGNKSIGSVIISDETGQLDSATLYQETRSMLELDNLKVEYTTYKNENEDQNFDENDDEFKLKEKVGADTEVTLTFKIKNLFDNDYDQDKGALEDIELNIDPDDSDLFAEDFEETYELDDLDANENQEFTINFLISEEADSQDYVLDIELIATDGEGSEYEIKKDLIIEVGRQNEDLRITKAKLVTLPITVCDASYLVDVEMKNFGKKDQKYTALSIYGEALGINKKVENVELERYSRSDNAYSNTFEFELPNKIKTGSYFLEVRAFINKDEQMDYEKIEFKLDSCPKDVNVDSSDEDTELLDSTQTSNTQSTTSTSQETSDNPNNGSADSLEQENNKLTSAAIIKTVENPYTSFDIMVAIIIIAIVVMLVLIVLFAIILLK
jgi:hypothetical protein